MNIYMPEIINAKFIDYLISIFYSQWRKLAYTVMGGERIIFGGRINDNERSLRSVCK